MAAHVGATTRAASTTRRCNSLLLGLACRSFSLASQHRSTAQGTAKVAARISTVVSFVQTALVLLLARATTAAARPASPPSNAEISSSQAHRPTRKRDDREQRRPPLVLLADARLELAVALLELGEVRLGRLDRLLQRLELLALLMRAYAGREREERARRGRGRWGGGEGGGEIESSVRRG